MRLLTLASAARLSGAEKNIRAGLATAICIEFGSVVGGVAAGATTIDFRAEAFDG